MKREDGRGPKDIRPVKITRNYLKYPEGSVLIEMGNTKVICTASVSDFIPHHQKGSGSGWVTAEYAMLPRATLERINREHRSRGRAQEIQRLVGRALRSAVDLRKLGERTIFIDADVIQADGGTRTAAITGAWVALRDCVSYLRKNRIINEDPLSEYLAAVSVGLVEGVSLLDLSYSEDSRASVDMNVVMTGSGKLVEVQGTAEGEPFSKKVLDGMLELAEFGIQHLIKKQKAVLRDK